MNPPSLLIFDCDGVLVDSEPLAAQAFAEALGEIGLPWTASEVESRFRGRSLRDCLSLVERERGALPAGFLETLNQLTFAKFRSGIQPIAGVRLAVEAVRKAGIPYCVASSGSHEKMRLTLGLTGLLPFFEGRLYSATEVEQGKPAPDLFLFAARQMGVKIGESVVVEDSLPGVQAGVSAGARVLGYCPPPALTRSAAKERSIELQQLSPLEQASHRDTLLEWGVVPFASMSDLPDLLGLTLTPT